MPTVLCLGSGGLKVGSYGGGGVITQSPYQWKAIRLHYEKVGELHPSIPEVSSISVTVI